MPASREQGKLKRDILKLWVLHKMSIPKITLKLDLTQKQVEDVITHSGYSLGMHNEKYWRDVIRYLKRGHSTPEIMMMIPVSRSFIKEVRRLCESPA